MTAAQQAPRHASVEAQILDCLRHGRKVGWVCDATGWQRRAVLQVAADGGLSIHPDTDIYRGVDIGPGIPMPEHGPRPTSALSRLIDGPDPDAANAQTRALRRSLDAPVVAVPDHVAHIAVINADRLFVDHAYQRPLDPRRIKAMAKRFDPTLVGVIDVSDRGDNRFAVVDGQHRWALVAQVSGPATPMACNVHRGLSVVQEAALFYAIDRGRTALSGFDRWKARRGAGDETVLAIEACLGEYGMRVDTNNTPGVIRASRALEKIWKLGGAGLLRDTLDVITAAYGDNPDGLVGEILLGVALVRAYYTAEEISLDRLVLAMQGVVSRQLVARAGALREVHKGEMPRMVAAVLIDTHNALPGRRAQPFLLRLPAGGKRAPGISPERRAELDARRAGHAAKKAGPA